MPRRLDILSASRTAADENNSAVVEWLSPYPTMTTIQVNRSGRNDHVQRSQPAETKVTPVHRRLIDQLNFWAAPDQRPKHHRALQPGQTRADAEVWADPERDVFALVPREYERVGVGEVCRVPVGGPEYEVHRLPVRDECAHQVDVATGPPGDHLRRGVVPQHLLDRLGHQPRVGPQLLSGVGVSQECVQAVADQVGRRLVAGDEQDQDRAVDFVLRQPP